MRRLLPGLVLLGSCLVGPGCSVHADVLVCYTDDQARAQLAMDEVALKAVGDPAADTYIVLRNLLKAAQGKPCLKPPVEIPK